MKAGSAPVQPVCRRSGDASSRVLWAVLAAGVLTGCPDFVITPVPTSPSPYELVVEEFTQAPVPGRDILWLLDNTRSMKEEAAALAPLFSDFIEGLNLYDREISYQVGIVTTDLIQHGGALQGMPWIITRETPGAEAAFEENVYAAVSPSQGVPSPEEGLEAIATALSDPLLAPGGRNYGFLREEAGLSVIAVSDSDDLSEGAVEEYAAYLINLKGGASADRVIFSAIAGPPDTGCLGTGGRNASPAPRYFDLTEALNGVFASICSDNFGELVASLGEHQVALQTRFPLSRVPVDHELFVYVEGARSPKGTAWQYDEALNMLVFQPGSVPPYGATVRVSYHSDPTAS